LIKKELEAMSKIRGLVQLIRPINCLMMGFAVFVGVILAHPTLLTSFFLNILFGFSTGFFFDSCSNDN
jgi:4-hydroxybenzoate polyprenyltransferase